MIEQIVNSFYPLTPSSLDMVKHLLVHEHYCKGEHFIFINRRNSKEYFLLEGICKSYLLNPDGVETTLSFFQAPTILSPHTIRTHDGLSSLNFKALTDVEMASMDALEFEKLMIEDEAIRNFGNAVLRAELLKKVQKEIGMASLAGKERLLQFRKEFPMLENLVPHTDIATYLGITNITLSRLRRELI
jgi:CRP-like cAMP-binding protein